MAHTKCIMITAFGNEGRFTDTIEEAKTFFDHAIECEASSVWVCKDRRIVCEIAHDQLKNSRDLLAAYCHAEDKKASPEADA